MDTNAVAVAPTGKIYRAPLGSTVPVTPTEEWTADWAELGWIGEDGFEEDPNDDTKEIKAWQHGTTVRRLITGSTHNFKFKAIESNAVTLELYHKGSTIETADGVHTLKVMTPSPERWMFGFDVIDGDNHLRIIIEDGEVAERSAIAYKNDEAIGYEFTVTAYAIEDEDGNTYTAIKLSDAPAWESVGGS
jgi:hypothetical protein